jgi:hypothetical protein
MFKINYKEAWASALWDRIHRQEAQIESLKCCGNCSYYERDGEYPYTEYQCRHVSWAKEGNPYPDEKCEHWKQAGRG